MNIEYVTGAGEDITTAIKNSLKLSKRYDTETWFNFNDIIVKTNHKSDTPDSIYSEWKVRCELRSAKYTKSAEYQIKQDRIKNELLIKQSKLDSLVSNLNVHMENVTLLRWLISFTECADHCGTTYDKEQVLEIFNRMGFKEHMWVGYLGEWTTSHEIEYVVGQVINCINQMGSPHPVTVTFCEKILNGESL